MPTPPTKPTGKGAHLVAAPEGAVRLTDLELAELKALTERLAAKQQTLGDLQTQYEVQKTQLVNECLDLLKNRSARIGEVAKAHDIASPNVNVDLKTGIISPV